MGKLFKLKEWLTVADTARRLSIAFGEEVSEADVLRLALDMRLRLSIHFVNQAIGRGAERISLGEDTELLEFLESLRKRHGEDPMTAQEKSRPVFRYDDSIVVLTGVWDLPMIGNERLDVEHKYQVLTRGPHVTLQGIDGAFVETRDGKIFQLQEAFKEQRRAKPATENYHPASGLPKDAVIVVRTEALREFERHSNDEPLPTSRAHISHKLTRMNQASTRFWGNADRDDRSTHPDNATVAAWLVSRDFSPTLADKAATIIRPEWAPTGRKPEE